MTKLRPHLTYANVVATLALIAAVGGGTTAIAISAKKAPKNSVTSKSIRPGNVTAGDLGTVRTITENAAIGSNLGTFELRCPKGFRPISGGGYVIDNTPAGDVGLLGSHLAGTTWVVRVKGGAEDFASGSVYCLSNKPGKPESG
jgi:hypothetical protein